MNINENRLRLAIALPEHGTMRAPIHGCTNYRRRINKLRQLPRRSITKRTAAQIQESARIEHNRRANARNIAALDWAGLNSLEYRTEQAKHNSRIRQQLHAFPIMSIEQSEIVQSALKVEKRNDKRASVEILVATLIFAVIAMLAFYLS